MQTCFANVTQRTTDWQSVNWRKAFRVVRNLRQRIFKATRLGNWRRVRNLQRLLLKSDSNVLLAVRRVTQINAGKHTPGIDKPRTGWKLLIKPAKKSVMAFREKLRQTFKRLHGSNAQCLIKVLNPIIRGWATYYRGVVSSETFHKLEHYIFWKLRRWISKTHPNKSFSWRNRRYWANHPAYPSSQWSFVDKDTGMVLHRIGYTRIQRHTLIQGDASPDNPELQDYFEQRVKQTPAIGDYPKAAQQVICCQQSKCPNCGQSLFNGEEMEKKSTFITKFHVNKEEPTTSPI